MLLFEALAHRFLVLEVLEGRRQSAQSCGRRHVMPRLIFAQYRVVALLVTLV